MTRSCNRSSAPPTISSLPVRRAGAGAVRLSEHGLLLGVPGLALVPSFSDDELRAYGGEQRAEVHIPVFTGVF